MRPRRPRTTKQEGAPWVRRRALVAVLAALAAQAAQAQAGVAALVPGLVPDCVPDCVPVVAGCPVKVVPSQVLVPVEFSDVTAVKQPPGMLENRGWTVRRETRKQTRKRHREGNKIEK